MKLRSFSNKRQATSVEAGMFLYVSQTESKVRITADVAKAMGVVAGDYVAVGYDEETKKTLLFKGMKSDDVQVGNKLAGSLALEFMSKNVWDELGGAKDHNLKYIVVEEPIVEDEVSYWELTDKEVLAARVRTKSEATDNKEQEPTKDKDASDGNGVPNTSAPEGFSLD